MMVRIGPETPGDHQQIATLHREAFGSDVVPRLVGALRDTSAAVEPISLVAKSPDEQVIGHVMLSAAWLDAPPRLVDVMTLSPLAVAPAWRRQGIGGALIKSALGTVENAGKPLVFLEGDPHHYSPHGFVAAEPLGFRRPSLRIPEAAFQVKILAGYESWMTGTFVYPDVFWELDCVGLRA